MDLGKDCREFERVRQALSQRLRGAYGLFDGAAGDAGDEAVEEQIVGDRHRHAGDQRAGHELAPEEDVAAHEIGRHAERDRLLSDDEMKVSA